MCGDANNMAVKEIRITVKISEEGVASLVQKNGFEDTASSHFEFMGILQNLIALEQEKIKKIAYAKK